MTIGLKWNRFLVAQTNLNLLMMILLKPLLREKSTVRRFLRKLNSLKLLAMHYLAS